MVLTWPPQQNHSMRADHLVRTEAATVVATLGHDPRVYRTAGNPATRLGRYRVAAAMHFPLLLSAEAPFDGHRSR